MSQSRSRRDTPGGYSPGRQGQNGSHICTNRDTTLNKESSSEASPNVDPEITNTEDRFDEYGTELGRDARVWKVYVKEADKFDAEHVDGWNRSLDVTLIIAALFTAICTAFVIESYKSLKEDPAVTASQQLDQIILILSTLANMTNSSVNSTVTIGRAEFTPRPVDLCVNALWFFSLTLGAAVSLISMLAKEWCYIFLSGRVGEPWSQTKRRQQRWKGIEDWKMEHVVMFLPSLIHLAFLSFAVGLCIFLGDLSVSMATPAILVTAGSIVVYLASTVLPLRDEACPYSTTLYRLTKGSLATAKESLSMEEDGPERECIAIDALAWLIQNSEDPNSLNIALQAIAGARDDNPNNRALLKKHDAPRMIYKRLIAINPYRGSDTQLQDLYERACTFFHGQNGSVKTHEGVNHTGRLREELCRLKTLMEKQIFEYVTSSEFIPSAESIEALRIGISAPSDCLQSIIGRPLSQVPRQAELSMNRLEACCKGDIWVQRPTLGYLVIGSSVLLSRIAAEWNRPTVVGKVMWLLRMRTDFQRSLRSATYQVHSPTNCDAYFGLLIAVVALCRADYPGWTHRPKLTPTKRAEQAIQLINNYATNVRDWEDQGIFKTMINFGLLDLLANADKNELTESDFKTISMAFASLWDVELRDRSIRALLLPFQAHSQSIAILTERISKDGDDLFKINQRAVAYLTALHRTRMGNLKADPPTAIVYAFVVEAIYQLPLEPYTQSIAFDLMQDFYACLREIPDLAQILASKGIITRLVEIQSGASDYGSDFVKLLFAQSQMWLLIRHALHERCIETKDWRQCLAPLLGVEQCWNPPVFAEITLQQMERRLAEKYREMQKADKMPRHKYFEFVATLCV